jgi:AcrR family transcriptional regulator
MPPRAYTQTARADATQRTRRAILGATQVLFQDEGRFDPPLDLVAERAGVTTRTVLRHFGSKEGLIEAAAIDARERVAASREAPPGDVATAVRKLVDHYEQMGDATLRLLAEAERHPVVKQVTDAGTALHVQWVEEVFAPFLDGLAPAARHARVALLATVTDLQAWALLRRRHGLSRRVAEDAIRGLADHAKGAVP